MTSDIATAGDAAPQARALYDAFVSYSHAKDKPAAAALQGVMQRLGKPWHKRRALRIFRDDTSLAATPELWPSIEQALSQSRYLIVLASPQFAASKWCGMEVAYWLENKSLDTLLIGLTEGELSWDDASRDFRWDEATPLTPALRGKFRAEPKWIDLRAHRESPEHRDAKLIDAAADLAAAVHGIPKEDLLSQEVRQQKRALALAWSAAAVLLALTGAAGWQWLEADRAKRAAIAAEQVATEQKVVAQKAEAQAVAERDRAEKNLALARKAAEDLVFKIAQGLRNVQGMRVESIRQILETAQGVMDELVRSAADDPQLQRSRAAMFNEFSTTFLAAGASESALFSALEAVAIARRFLALDPDHLEWSSTLSGGLQRAGDARRAVGDRTGALADYEACLTIARITALRLPTSATAHRNISVILNRIGDLRLSAGDRAGGQAAYEEGLAALRQLVMLSESAQERWDLGVSLEKIGSARLANGDRSGAATAYEEALGIRRRLVAATPGNLLWQHGLSISLVQVADLRIDGGEWQEGLALYEESLVLRRMIASADPTNADWRHYLGSVLDRIAGIRVSMGDITGARNAAEECLDIRRRLAAGQPVNVEWQTNLQIVLWRLADIRLRTGQKEGVLALYEESVTIGQKLVASDPNNVELLHSLSVSLVKSGNARLAFADSAGALTRYEESLGILRRLMAADRENAAYRIDLAISLFKISTIATAPAARAALTEAIAILDRLESEGKLTTAQRNWPRIFREALAKLPPETADAN